MSDVPIPSRMYDYTIKVVALGNAAVGKTSCIRRFVEGVFTADYIATLGTIFSTKVIEATLPNGQNHLVRLILWDLAGQDGYQELRKRYMAGARMGFITYDVTRRETFDVIKEWHSRFIEECPEAIVALVANKIDLDNHAVTRKEGKQLAKAINAEFYETSAKTGDNVERMFIEGINEVFELLDLV